MVAVRALNVQKRELNDLVNAYMMPLEKTDVKENYSNYNHRRLNVKNIIKEKNASLGLDPFDIENAKKILEKELGYPNPDIKAAIN